MALSATSPHDLEAQAWHAVQLPRSISSWGRPQARLETERRSIHFRAIRRHWPCAATIQAAAGDLGAAAESLQAAMAAAHRRLARRLGDVHAARGQRLEAERAYARADAAWTTETPEPREHALFLAMHGRDLARAVALAEQATRGSRDILSSEAHAWAAFRRAISRPHAGRSTTRCAPVRACGAALPRCRDLRADGRPRRRA